MHVGSKLGMFKSNNAFSFIIDVSKGSGGTANSFYLPIANATYVNNITVDWGDGSIETITSGTYPFHIYADNSIRKVSIYSTTGKIPLLTFGASIYTTTNTYNSGNLMLLSIITPLLTYYNGAVIATDLSYCFGKCSNLSYIPTDLFRNNTTATNLSSCFYACASITAIPTDLFRYNTSVTSFSSCFSLCTLLETIPTDLFRYNTAVNRFGDSIGGCFSDCSSLTSIPTDLFRYNTEVLYFQNCFNRCTSLTSIPTNLFAYNTKVVYLYNCFYGCTALTTTINPVLGGFFASSLPATGMRVQRMFYNCSASSGNATNFVSLFAGRTSSNTYRAGAVYNCTTWTGYSSIAEIWKTA